MVSSPSEGLQSEQDSDARAVVRVAWDSKLRASLSDPALTFRAEQSEAVVFSANGPDWESYRRPNFRELWPRALRPLYSETFYFFRGGLVRVVAAGRSAFRFFAAASEAFLARAERSSGVIVSRLRLPPILPPLRPISRMTSETKSFFSMTPS
jgi:hypothetical protein